MSVRKTKQGRYEVRVQHEGRRVRAGTYDTREEAEKVETHTLMQLRTKSYVKNVMDYQHTDQKFTWHNPLTWLRRQREERAKDEQTAANIEQM